MDASPSAPRAAPSAGSSATALVLLYAMSSPPPMGHMAPPPPHGPSSSCGIGRSGGAAAYPAVGGTPTKCSGGASGSGTPSGLPGYGSGGGTQQEQRQPLWSPKGPRVTYSDRFIPSRSVAARLDFSLLDREVTTSEVTKSTAEREDLNPAYDALLRSELLYCGPSGSTSGAVPPASPEKPGGSCGNGGAGVSGAAGGGGALPRISCPSPSPSKRLFRYMAGDAQSPIGGAAPPSPYSRSPLGHDGGASPFASPKAAARKIPRAPFKVLDAPALSDDFYLNLVDWGAQNVLAVGLSNCVYLWSAHTSKVTKLCEVSANDSVSSVAWSMRGSYLSVGTQSGAVQIWDVARMKLTRTLEGHKGRVGCQSWSSGVLSSGSRDRTILHRDVRVPDEFVGKLTGHRSEVCGLKWSPDGSRLASGGNDNNLFVWGAASSAGPVHRFTDHVAAVKAIAWSPHQHGLLASGGGTADRCIRFWNTVSGTAINSIDTGSQVCNLSWSKNVNEIVSTHGYSQNQVVVWQYPTMKKIAALSGHSLRVLYLAASPDGQTIVTGAGDETLRFWSVFPGAKAQGSESSITSMARTMIR
ncbi:hypothetical protein FOA52_005133 [Chlamydomonas sp. UWO 241]|nr:hypothetical protein FOA52_005133 [Chlamydomonas sp. UWO 241]